MQKIYHKCHLTGLVVLDKLQCLAAQALKAVVEAASPPGTVAHAGQVLHVCSSVAAASLASRFQAAAADVRFDTNNWVLHTDTQTWFGGHFRIGARGAAYLITDATDPVVHKASTAIGTFITIAAGYCSKSRHDSRHISLFMPAAICSCCLHDHCRLGPHSKNRIDFVIWMMKVPGIHPLLQQRLISLIAVRVGARRLSFDHNLSHLYSYCRCRCRC